MTTPNLSPSPNPSPTQISVENQSLVFTVFEDTEKLTISEVTERVNEKLKAADKLRVSEQTVRRAIMKLKKHNFLQEFGRQHNATLYGKVGTSWITSDEDEKLLTLAGIRVTVKDFLELIVDEEANPHPFVVKVQPQNWAITDEFARKLRKRLTAIVLSSTDAGYEEALKAHARFLQNHITELEHITNVMKTFLESSVWYPHHRDRISRELRKVQQASPELIKLAIDYTKEG